MARHLFDHGLVGLARNPRTVLVIALEKSLAHRRGWSLQTDGSDSMLVREQWQASRSFRAAQSFTRTASGSGDAPVTSAACDLVFASFTIKTKNVLL
jgi:hypothetical protein